MPDPVMARMNIFIEYLNFPECGKIHDGRSTFPSPSSFPKQFSLCQHKLSQGVDFRIRSQTSQSHLASRVRTYQPRSLESSEAVCLVLSFATFYLKIGGNFFGNCFSKRQEGIIFIWQRSRGKDSKLKILDYSSSISSPKRLDNDAV